MSIIAEAKALAVGVLIGGAILGTFGFYGGYSWGSGDLEDMKSRLANQEVKVVTVNAVTKEIVYQGRIVYQDKVNVIKEKIPFLVEKEVYKNVCLDHEGLSMFNTLMGR